MNCSSESIKKVKEGFIGQKMVVLPPDIRKEVSENTLISGIYLTAIGFYPHAVYHDRERGNGSQEYILLYCAKGEGFLFLQTKKFKLTPNSFIIIPPNLSHHYRSSESKPWSIYWVHFTGKYANIIYSRYTNNQNLEIKSIPYYKNRLNLFNKIISLLENGFSERNLEVANIHFLHFISSLVYQSEINSSSYTKDAVTKSINYMKKNIEYPLTIKQLANKHNLSVSRYSELFNKKTGYSPIKYFIQLKIQKSCQYLYFTDLNLKEISTKVGFEDPFYFSRTFKKLMGVSPSKYKKTFKS